MSEKSTQIVVLIVAAAANGVDEIEKAIKGIQKDDLIATAVEMGIDKVPVTEGGELVELNEATKLAIAGAILQKDAEIKAQTPPDGTPATETGSSSPQPPTPSVEQDPPPEEEKELTIAEKVGLQEKVVGRLRKNLEEETIVLKRLLKEQNANPVKPVPFSDLLKSHIATERKLNGVVGADEEESE